MEEAAAVALAAEVVVAADGEQTSSYWLWWEGTGKKLEERKSSCGGVCAGSYETNSLVQQGPLLAALQDYQ